MYFPFFPPDAKPINQKVAIGSYEGEMVLFNYIGAFFTCKEDDKAGIRLAQAILKINKLASAPEIAAVFEVNRSTVNRNVKIYKATGPPGFIDDRTDRAPYKFIQEKQLLAQEMLDKGFTIGEIEAELEISYPCIRGGVALKGFIKKIR